MSPLFWRGHRYSTHPIPESILIKSRFPTSAESTALGATAFNLEKELMKENKNNFSGSCLNADVIDAICFLKRN